MEMFIPELKEGIVEVVGVSRVPGELKLEFVQMIHKLIQLEHVLVKVVKN